MKLCSLQSDTTKLHSYSKRLMTNGLFLRSLTVGSTSSESTASKKATPTTSKSKKSNQTSWSLTRSKWKSETRCTTTPFSSWFCTNLTQATKTFAHATRTEKYCSGNYNLTFVRINCSIVRVDCCCASASWAGSC